MNPWLQVGHPQTVRRVHDWQRHLGPHYAGWQPLLQRVADPVGLQFVADFGAGAGEFELAHDEEGFVALPVDGVTPHRLNVTEAEFARLDLVAVLRTIAEAASFTIAIEPLTNNGLYTLGKRTFSGKSVVVLAAPRGLDAINRRDRERLVPRAHGAAVSLLLLPEEASVSLAARAELTAMKVALAELPCAAPWPIDWSPLVVDDHFDVPLTDPALFFGARYAVIVEKTQQRVWLEGRDLKVKADGQSYRLFAHLAERPMTAIPVSVLANKVLEVDSDRLESKIVSDAKHELMKAIRACLTPTPDAARIVATTLVTIEDARAMLNVDPSLVKVIRRLSDD